MREIDLSRIATTREGRLDGFARGESAREHFALDVADREHDLCVVSVPPSIRGLGDDFLAGFIGPSLSGLGRAFDKRYHIDAPPRILAAFDAFAASR